MIAGSDPASYGISRSEYIENLRHDVWFYRANAVALRQAAERDEAAADAAERALESMSREGCPA